MNTRTSTQVMKPQLSATNRLTKVLVGFTFSPDFNTPGATGYQKLYVSSSQYAGGASPVERVEEYTVNPLTGAVPVDGSGHAIASQLILQYNNINTGPKTTRWTGSASIRWLLRFQSVRPNAIIFTLRLATANIGDNARNRPEQKGH